MKNNLHYFSANHLSFAYNEANSFQFPDIQLAKEEQLLLIGPSGVGKSTLLQLLAGLRKPNSGELRLGNTQYSSLPARQLDRFRGENIGVVFQRPHFVEALTVEENLKLLQRVARKRPNKQRVSEILAVLGIENKKQVKPQQLSQGEQQRVGLAMALVNQPSLILADEPTASLDDSNCEKVLSLLQAEASRSEANLVVITHDRRVKELFGKKIELK